MHFILPIFLIIAGTYGCSNVTELSQPAWEELLGKRWTWAKDSMDMYTHILRCGDATFQYDNANSKLMLSIRYGPRVHQVYTLEGQHDRGNRYLLPTDFNRSWKMIMTYNYPYVRRSYWSKGTSDDQVPVYIISDKKHHVIIAVLCLPNGSEAVWAFTKHRRVTPNVRRVIDHELEAAAVTTKVRLSSCPRYRKQSNE